MDSHIRGGYEKLTATDKKHIRGGYMNLTTTDMCIRGGYLNLTSTDMCPWNFSEILYIIFICKSLDSLPQMKQMR